MTDLKNCPFCGEAEDVQARVSIGEHDDSEQLVECRNCGATMARWLAPAQFDEREKSLAYAIEAWNRRADTRDAIEAEIVAWLREMKRDDTNWPQVIAGKIERGEYRSMSDAHRPSDIDH